MFTHLLGERHPRTLRTLREVITIMDDPQRKGATLRRILAAHREIYGNASAAVAVFFGLQAFGRVPAMLNFSAGAGPMLAACRAAQATRVVTSRRFVEMGGLEDLVAALAEEVEVLYLEDIAARIGILSKLGGWLSRPFAGTIHRRAMGTAGTDSPSKEISAMPTGSTWGRPEK